MAEPIGSTAWIAIAPVKSMALVPLERAVLDRTGVAGDRAFAMIDADDRLVNGKRIGQLVRIRPEVDLAAGRLALRFPDGPEVAGQIAPGASVDAWFFGHQRPVRLVDGPWSEALSDWVGQPLRLVAMAEAGDGLDRGPSVSLLSTAALTSLARAGGEAMPLDGRRFRMTFGIHGVPAHAEDAWIGHDVRIGSAVVRVIGNVGRCAVTTQDPDTGRPTFDTLRVLQATRGTLDSSEPLPCGVWADVVTPGVVVLGDPIERIG